MVTFDTFGAVLGRQQAEPADPVQALVLVQDLDLAVGRGGLWRLDGEGRWPIEMGEPLVDAVSDPGGGASMATIEDAALPGTFNTSGGSLTYAGLAWITDRGQPIPETEPDLIDVAFPSGSAMAITAETWASFAGFRPDLFMYHEDTDLGWRLRLGGQRIVRASASRVTHRYDFSRSPGKMSLLCCRPLPVTTNATPPASTLPCPTITPPSRTA